MLKIDADGLLTEKNSAECLSKTENSNNELHISASNKPPMDSELCTYDNKPEKEIPAHAHLSYREEQVLKLIALGKTRKEIAAQLFLSISTINTYRARILEKMNMKNNADLMRYAFKHRLIE
jgi:DNA-binding NarL/FixJ family response regulator